MQKDTATGRNGRDTLKVPVVDTATNETGTCQGCGFCNLGVGPIPPVIWRVIDRLLVIGKLTVREINKTTGVSERSIYSRKKEKKHVNN